ncbi:hypothetical protein UlMin_008090 [Ulmus minor]
MRVWIFAEEGSSAQSSSHRRGGLQRRRGLAGFRSSWVTWLQEFFFLLSRCPLRFSLDPIMASAGSQTSSSYTTFGSTQASSMATTPALQMLSHSLPTLKKGSMSMMDYLMKLKGFSNNLAVVEEPVSEQDQIMNILAGLEADYNAVVTAINSRDDTISLEAIHSMLLSYEHRLELQNSIDNVPMVTANLASTSQNRGGGRRFNGGRGQGPNAGNNSQNYRSRGRGNRGGRSHSYSSDRPQCQLCGKFGHTVHVCYHRFDISFQGNQNQSPSTSTNQAGMTAMVASPSTTAEDAWFLDSGASHHLTQSAGSLNNVTPNTGANRVTIGNGKKLSISNLGSKILQSNSHSFNLKKVFHVPFISANLISVAKFYFDNNAIIKFTSNSFFVKDQCTRKVLAQGKLENGLYRFPVLTSQKTHASNKSSFQSSVSAFTSILDKSALWHCRFGHANADIVQRIIQSCNIHDSINKTYVCSSCQYAKSHRLPFKLSFSRASKPLELIHTDLWGPASITSTNGARYFILFVDDHTRFTWFFPLQTKDHALPTFKQFKTLVENQFETKIKCLQSNNGGEFRSFLTFLTNHGIAHRFSCPYTSSQNGRVERKHRHVVETGLALLAHASMPLKFWQYAFQAAIFLINRMPTKVLKFASPYSLLYKKQPDYKSFLIFGCLCYPFIRPYNSHKLQYRSIKCTFLGYSTSHKGFLCLDNSSGRVYITPHVVFDESNFPFHTPTPCNTPYSSATALPTPAIINPMTFTSSPTHLSSSSFPGTTTITIRESSASVENGSTLAVSNAVSLQQQQFVPEDIPIQQQASPVAPP